MPYRLTGTGRALSPVADNQNGPSAEILRRGLHGDQPEHGNHRSADAIQYSGGWATLRIETDISAVTRAGALQPGAETRTFLRFSRRLENPGLNGHDVCEFSLRFFTPDGIWDLLGQNVPVFFTRDAGAFAAFLHGTGRHPWASLESGAALWDFVSKTPECLNQITLLMSARTQSGLSGTAPSDMNGYGGHTYSLWNAEGCRTWVKFRFRALEKAAPYAFAGVLPDDQQMLAVAIAGKKPPRWAFEIQVMAEEAARAAGFDIFDPTLVWPEDLDPALRVGTLELDKLPDEDASTFADMAFSPSNIVPGIGFSPDPLLQRRLFCSADAHRFAPGGQGRFLPRARHYEPNGAAGDEGDDENFADIGFSPVGRLEGERVEAEGRRQVRMAFDRLGPDRRKGLCDAIAAAICGCPGEIVERLLSQFGAIHPAYAEGVRAALMSSGRRN